jgi:hypothetical protein
MAATAKQDIEPMNMEQLLAVGRVVEIPSNSTLVAAKVDCDTLYVPVLMYAMEFEFLTLDRLA